MKKKSKWIYGVIVLLIIITWFFINKSTNKDTKSPSKNKMMIKVDALVASPTSLTNEIFVSGSLLGFEEVKLMNEIPGRVVRINLPEGEFVKKNTLLVKLFDDDIQANLKKLQTQLSIQEQLCKRQAELLKVNGISQNDYDQSILQLNSIKADIEVQKVLLRKTEILAPFDGVIGLRNISEGSVIGSSTNLATIRRMEKLKLDFSVPEKYSPEIKKGMKVKFTLYDETDYYEATVIATEHGISEDTRSLKVRAVVTSPSENLIPGAFANVLLSLGENKNAILIPSEAIIPREQDKSVIIAKNGKAHFVLVKTGVRKASQIEIIEGIHEGDTVITSGILFLKEGSKLIYSNIKNELIMLLSDIALKRPVGAVVMSLIIILMGILGYNFLGIRLYPAIDPPIITVRTSYTGANAEVIESQITEPLEKAINGIEGVKTISSQSAIGTSTITVEFDLGADLEKAANDVRDKVSQGMRSLPQDIDAPPTVTKADANSDPIIMLTVQSSAMNAIELSDYAENVLQEKLQTIPGVSAVSIYGQQKPAMRLWLDPKKMAAYNLTASDINIALDKENVEMPGGKIRGNSTELTIKTFGRLETEEDFNNLIIKQTDNQVVRLRNIGEAVLGPQNEESGATINGATGIMLVLIPLPGANNIQIADEFYKRLDQIKETMPKGLELIVSRDKSIFVRQSVTDVVETLFIAIFLVVLIIFLFFRDWKIALRPLVDIPVSLIGTFFVMYIFGFSINILTLLGIVLATGLVVDDGIVVTENIFKRIEKGMDKWKAAFEGTREIFFAVISTSLTLAIVFIPVIFLQGFTGRLFREFGIVVASAVLISAFVSLTLTPILNVKLGGSSSHHNRFYQSTEPFFLGMEKKYRRGLAYFIKNKWISFAILGVCIILIATLSLNLKSELAPLEDHSFIRTSVTAPEGYEYSTTQKILDEIAKLNTDAVPEANYVMARYGGGQNSSANTGTITAFLSDPNERNTSQQEIYDRLSKLYKTIPYARVIASQEPTITTAASRGLPVQFVLQNLDFEKIRTVLPKFLEEAQNSPVFSNVDVDLKFNKPELNIRVNRLKASSLGVSEKDVSDALDYAFSGSRYGYFLRNNKQYYVIGQLARDDRNMPADISSLYVRNNKGKMIQLDNLVTIEENSSPPTLYHFNRYKSATISANLSNGKTLGEGIAEMQKIADRLLDPTFTTALSGSSRDFAESKSNTSFALLLALVLIYLILAAQFESFIDPFIIMLTVPMAIAGAMLSLWVFGQTLNIFSEIGMILLIGIVTKNGILIVEFANQKRKAGMNKRVAAFNAASARFRPILMTSLATMFGALPIALALGAGASSRISLGIVVIGGLFLSLLLTLFVIPVAYIVMSAKKKKK